MLRRSLHARFLRAVVVFSAVLLGLGSLAVYQAARARYVAAETASVQALVSAVDKSLAVGAYANDKLLLQELIEGLARYPTVLRVEVRDASGAGLLAQTMQARGDALWAARLRGVPAEFSELLYSPFDEREPVGHLNLWIDTERLALQAGQSAALVAGVLVVIVLAVLASFNALARRMLSLPMHLLARELATIAPGSRRRVELDPRHADDEVGVVARAANQLLELHQDALTREREMREAVAELEARYRGIFDSSSAGLAVLSSAGRVLHGNPALWRLLAREPETDGLLLSGLFAQPQFFTDLIARSRTTGQAESADLELRRSDGAVVWLHCMLKMAKPDGDGEADSAQIEAVIYNVTSRHERERVAHHLAEHDALTGLKSRSFIETTLDSKVQAAQSRDASVTLMFVDLDGFKSVNDRWGHAAGDQVLIESARRLRSIFRRDGDMVGRLGGDELVALLEDSHASDPEVTDLAERLIEALQQPFDLPGGEQARIGASVGLASYPAHATNAQTLIHAADAAMYAVKRAGKGGYVIATASQNISVTHDASQRLRRHTAPARNDPLTGLPDRRALLNRMQRMEARLRSRGGHAAVLCLDLDDFENINLRHGTRTGDELLCDVAQRLRDALRRENFLARTGSDDFVALVTLDQTSYDEAKAAALTVAAQLQKALTAGGSDGRLPTVEASMGLSLMSHSAPDGHRVLQEAHLALRLAKSERGGNPVCFEGSMMDVFLEQSSLEDDLQQAVSGDQLRLFVQPQVGRQGRIVGGEALLRWHHPTRGLVGPAEFIPLAESSGAIIELGRWVLQRGCAVLARMRAEGSAHQTLAINVSPLQFTHADFVADVRDALHQSGAPADALILEITEGLLMSDLAQVGPKLRELAERGVRFSIDEFGTGFSSLSYLRQLPLHEIKIDRRFISGLPADQASVGIVRSLVAMGEHLGLRVVAEGVETPAQADFLGAYSQVVQQGWLHGRPQPADEFLGALSRRTNSPEPQHHGDDMQPAHAMP